MCSGGKAGVALRRRCLPNSRSRFISSERTKRNKTNVRDEANRTVLSEEEKREHTELVRVLQLGDLLLVFTLLLFGTTLEIVALPSTAKRHVNQSPEIPHRW